MKSLSIDIVNPKALKLLQDLEELGLITISDDKDVLADLVSEMQQLGEQAAISEEEILEEVKTVRKERYAGK